MMSFIVCLLPLYQTGGFSPKVESAFAELKVEQNRVCMPQNLVFDRDMIPVQLNDRTYYGCCEGCIVQITQNEALRMGQDGLTGENIDKSQAVVLDIHGKAMYFASAENAKKYLASRLKGN